VRTVMFTTGGPRRIRSPLQRTRHYVTSLIGSGWAGAKDPPAPLSDSPAAAPRVTVPPLTDDGALLREQLEYLEASSDFYRARIEGARELADLPFLTKADIRDSQSSHPPFGEHLC